eukprot:m51a1_g2389 hypothetical protein (118) ;mRNA; r:725640-726374
MPPRTGLRLDCLVAAAQAEEQQAGTPPAPQPSPDLLETLRSRVAALRERLGAMGRERARLERLEEEVARLGRFVADEARACAGRGPYAAARLDRLRAAVAAITAVRIVVEEAENPLV